MVASSIPPSTGHAPQPLDLAEWLRLRRPPLPDFVETLDRLPPGLSALVRPALPQGRPIDGALLMPAEYFARPGSAWDFAPERALVFQDGTALLACAESPDNPAHVTLLDAANLLYARSTLVLLNGLLEFKTVSGGQANEVRVEYNSVIWETFRPSLARFVAAANSPQTAPAGDRARAANAAANARILNSLPYKFANGLQYNGLTQGERLQAAVFQPEIRERRLIRSRQLTPHTVLALTDRKVVIVEDTLSLALHAQRKGEHGWSFTYIPRDRVVDMVVTPGTQRAELKIRLAWRSATDERSFVLDPRVAAKWQRAGLDS